MEDFVVSARKYRPQDFDSVVGQESITQTLLKSIKSNHLAQAFLFCGPRGVGKTTCARILAKTVNDLGHDDQGSEHDYSFNIFELDAASNNSVDDIRSLIDQVRIPPQVGKYKVYIIDEVHMLSSSAFNAFLKTLEEPPPYAIFILATTEKHKVLPTILSRCQIFDFNRIQIPDMVKHLQGIAAKENIEVDNDALHVIAEKADGALRDALSIFDQIVGFSGNTITYEDVIQNLNVLDYDYYFKITDAFLNSAHADVIVLFNNILEKGFDGHSFVNGLANHLRNLLFCTSEKTTAILEVGQNVREQYLEQSTRSPQSFILNAMNILSEADVNYKASKNPRLLVEIALIKICSLVEKKKKKKNSNYSLSAEESKPKNDPVSSSDSPKPKSVKTPSKQPDAQVEKKEIANVEPAKPMVSPDSLGEKPPNTLQEPEARSTPPENVDDDRENENSATKAESKQPDSEKEVKKSSPFRSKLKGFKTKGVPTLSQLSKGGNT
jgi:DNA polymerase-3 subunit gamma/tau